MGEVTNHSYDEVCTHHIGLERQALQIVEGPDWNQRRANHASYVHLFLDAVNGDSDFCLIVEYLPESDRTASAIIRYLAFVNVDRTLFRNLEEPRFQDACAEHQAKIGIEGRDKFERSIG